MPGSDNVTPPAGRFAAREGRDDDDVMAELVELGLQVGNVGTDSAGISVVIW